MLLLIGGARSGKSRLAVEHLARGSAPVTYIATARPDDAEMGERIRRHRESRPAHWGLIEAPVELDAALEAVPAATALIIDCLTLWVSNLMESHDDEDLMARVHSALSRVASRAAETVVVTNEVGTGLVPMSPVGRRFRDVQGGVNQMWASRADRAFLVVAGRLLPLAHPGGGLG